MKIPKAILNKAKKIKLLALDVDGVLTGGEVIILDSGEELKIWSVKDRMGFALLRKSGLPIKMAWITARKSAQVQKRAEELGVQFIYQKCPDKWQAVQECMKALNITSEEVAYVGDDYVDLRPLKNAGLAVCPPDSPKLVQEASHYQTHAPSGKGVVREVIEIILQAQNKWEQVLKHYLVFALLVLGGFLSSCTNPINAPAVSEKPDQWIEHFTITETSDGLPVWVLNADIAQIYNKQKRATLEKIQIQFMNTKGQKAQKTLAGLKLAKAKQTQTARLSAPKGEVHLDTHNLSAWGGVEVHSQDGSVLYTQDLHFSTDKQKVTTESPVKILRNGSVLLGEGMEATPDLSEVKIFRHEASIYPKEISSSFEKKEQP